MKNPTSSRDLLPKKLLNFGIKAQGISFFRNVSNDLKRNASFGRIRYLETTS